MAPIKYQDDRGLFLVNQGTVYSLKQRFFNGAMSNVYAGIDLCNVHIDSFFGNNSRPLSDADYCGACKPIVVKMKHQSDDRRLRWYNNERDISKKLSAIEGANFPELVDDFITEQNDMVLVFDYIDAEDLHDWYEKSGNKFHAGSKFYQRVSDIGSQAADLVGKAHESGIVHRDIKLANFLTDNNGVIYLLDFGLARMKGLEDPKSKDSIIGTPYFTAPESFHSDEYTEASDVYSLGVCLFKLVTDNFPYGGIDSRVAYTSNVARTDVEPYKPRRIVPEVPVCLDEFILKMLSNSPDLRPSPKDVQDELANFSEMIGLGRLERLMIWFGRKKK